MKKSTWKERFSKFILAVFVVGIIFSCSNIEQVQAASKKGTYYYGTVLNRRNYFPIWQQGEKRETISDPSSFISYE